MQNRQRSFRQLRLIAASGVALAAGAASLGATETSATGDITVTITEMRNAKGVVRACMTTNPDIFPRCRKDPESHRLVVAAGEDMKLQFRNVKPGRYAIALLHDENNNGKADRALGMMPKEGFGFSRDAKVRMAPPKFKDAVFDYKGDDRSLTVKMRYML
ncbi:DUF2141 domain-containing protein [Altererythrobacter sp. MF3-039]|uniref:DUF2141 domain-containing protein n=1 Tax=Altererythrobacter sp. MF3-039 TaxID=3252901 RepID=UPI00390CAC2D